MKHTTLPLLILIGLATVAVTSPGIYSDIRDGLAMVGVGATVPATPINTRFAELDQRTRELDERERALQQQEDRVALWAALSVVAGLVAVNFLMDWRRNR
jgi:hypothetical protein